MYDIAIIGAGAAGLTAAIFARRTNPDARIVLLDGAPRIGAKILISVSPPSSGDGSYLQEAVLTVQDLESADAIYLCNSLRGLRKV